MDRRKAAKKNAIIELSKDFDSIFNSIDGFFVIDTDEKIVCMSENLLEQVCRTKEETIGRSIHEVMPHNVCYKILKSGKKQIGQMYFIEGYTIVSNGYPIYKDGELIGAFEFDVFGNIGFVEAFLEKVDTVGEFPAIRRRKKENAKAKYSIDDIQGGGAAIRRLKSQIIDAAKSSSTVMITGETGSGKELVAHAIHRLSARSLFHFVRLNCAAIPADLFESEIFGYEEGSFTGAKKGGQFGKAEIANNGTLFLDEIDNLTLNMQAKILRFLQEKEILRVGGDFAIPVNTRVIAATNRNPLDLVKDKVMREDLYYRLNVLEIRVPPLRERREDIPQIVKEMIADLNQYLDKSAHSVGNVSEEAMEALMGYDWPGNVRELKNIVERAMNRSRGKILKLSHFDEFIQEHGKNTGKVQSGDISFPGQTLKALKHEFEKQIIKNALVYHGQNMTKAAEALGISRQMLHRKISDYQEEEAAQERESDSKQKLTSWGRT